MRTRVRSRPEYAARGMAEEWKDFNNFLFDMGERPEGMTLDRIDNDRGYFPDNCRWATPSQQSINRKSSVMLEYKGECLCIREWSKRTGLHEQTILHRHNAGWDVERILTQPSKRKN